MILPHQGFHDALRALTRQHGTLLILDETHTLSSSPSGYSGAYGLEPDILTCGKSIAGGIPAAVWGVTSEVSARMDAAVAETGPGSSGIGTTLSGNALVMSAIVTMLEEVITPEAYEVMLAGTDRLVAGLKAVIERLGLPWCVVHVGARAELVFAPKPPENAETMRCYLDHDLLAAFHLYLMNQGILIAPFHNMMLISPQTEISASDRLVAAVESFGHIYRDIK